MKSKKQPATKPVKVDVDILPLVRLTATQQKEAKKQLAAARARSQKDMSLRDIMEFNLLRLRFEMEHYLTAGKYDSGKTFGYFLGQYIGLLDIKRKEFAAAISIDETFLSQLINGHRFPPDYLVVRLEIHSENLVPADYWLKLVELQKQHEIKTDKALRKKEQKYVHARFLPYL